MTNRDYDLGTATYRLGAAHADAEYAYRVVVGRTDDDRPHELDVRFQPLGAGVGVLALGTRRTRVVYAVDGAHVIVHQSGHIYRFVRHTGPRSQARACAGDLTAPMPGAIVAVHVVEGDAVVAGQVLLVLEAMKMQQEVRAPFPGSVATVHHAAGDRVDAGAHLVDITPAPELEP